MVKVIQSYEDSSGKMHRNAYEAHRAELAIHIASSSIVNEGQSVQLAEWLSDICNASIMIDTLKQIVNSVPNAVDAA